MKKELVLVLALVLIFLTGCSQTNISSDKKDFFIEMEKCESFSTLEVVERCKEGVLRHFNFDINELYRCSGEKTENIEEENNCKAGFYYQLALSRTDDLYCELIKVEEQNTQEFNEEKVEKIKADCLRDLKFCKNNPETCSNHFIKETLIYEDDVFCRGLSSDSEQRECKLLLEELKPTFIYGIEFTENPNNWKETHLCDDLTNPKSHILCIANYYYKTAILKNNKELCNDISIELSPENQPIYEITVANLIEEECFNAIQ